MLFYLCKVTHNGGHSWTPKPTWQKHNSSIRTNWPAQMFSLYEDTTYFLRILRHLYLPCQGRFLDLQRIRTGGFISTASGVAVSLPKCTTTISTANYKESSKKEEPLFPLHLLCLHHTWGHWQARAEPHTDTKSYQITPKHQYSVKPMTTRTAGPMRMSRGQSPSPHWNKISWDEQRQERPILTA